MENLFFTKKKKLIKEWIPINGNIGNWQADLLFLENYKKYNHNYGIFLVLIEITSRYGVVYPLKKNPTLMKLLKNLSKFISQL